MFTFRITAEVQITAASEEEAAKEAVKFVSSGETVTVAVSRMSESESEARLYDVDLPGGSVSRRDSLEESLADIVVRFG